jgi:hypothetical protein
MTKVTVYQYMVLGTNLGEPSKARRWERGRRLRSQGEQYAAALVEAPSVDSIGFTGLDFDPHSA